MPQEWLDDLAALETDWHKKAVALESCNGFEKQLSI
jgi:hypothetical protein